MNSLLQDREHAGRLLGKKLSTYKDNAIVVGIPNGGVGVAFSLAESLSLPLEVFPCRKIKHPADGKRAIGSMTVNETLMHDYSHNIPQDYVYHQIALVRHALQHEQDQYYRNKKQPSFLYKNVILVDDVLDSSSTMLACLRGIKKQRPLKVIVAVPLVTAEAARLVRAEADDLVFLQMEAVINSPADYYENFPRIDQLKVMELLELSRKTLPFHE